jgi:hypothetical protein
MGQYYLIVNVTKKQFIHPHRFDDGMKLMEFAPRGNGTMMALAVLLSNGNGRGGGDLQSGSDIVGSWAGDQIVIAGDYGDPGKFIKGVSRKHLQEIADESFSEGHRDADNVTLYHLARADYEDVSETVRKALYEDPFAKEGLDSDRP